MGKIAWLVRDTDSENWLFKAYEHETHMYAQVKRIVYFEVEN